ncbi:MAG: nucleoside hydrolase [Chloroflexi bacterium]|nr:nucleoside hydrolase [Chloroflexota bacterium]
MSPLARFPRLSVEHYQRILREPAGRVRCVIDTDTRNEIDDQYALAWAFLSRDKLEIEGLYAAPYSFQERVKEQREAERIRQRGATSDADGALLARHIALLRRLDEAGIDVNDDRQLDPQGTVLVSPGQGMELSYQEILKVCDKLDLDFADRVFRGSDRYLASPDEPVESEAVAHLIGTAKTATVDDPLHVVAIGAATNVAAALLLAPEIIETIVVSWTAGYPTTVMDIVQPSFNMEQDVLASQLLFDSGVPLVYLPGFHVGAQLSLSLPEVESWVKGKGEIGDYLHWLYINSPHLRRHGIFDHFARSWIMWDLINFAWLINPAWVPTFLTDAPYLSADCRWYRQAQPRHIIREALDINRDAIYRDFFGKLAALAG